MPEPSFRSRAGAWIESRPVQHAIVVLILLNAVVLGIETDASVMARIGPALKLVDHLVLGVFVLEIGIKLFAFRLRFFANPWNLFDTLVVAVSLHLLVLIEEEHLRRVFGQPYIEFCRRVPRYFGPRRSDA